MSGKRKDSNGRVLRDGESQRPNGTYIYRYTNSDGKRISEYSKSLKELREIESKIKRDTEDGIDYAAANITVSELIDRYMLTRTDLKENSLRAYATAINRIKESKLGQRKIDSIKTSDAKLWFIEMHNDGYKRNTISIVHTVIRPAFEMAVEDDLIRKNPFRFKLSTVLSNDMTKRQALTLQQQNEYLNMVVEYGPEFYDDIVILLNTGLRVSELYGLTKMDIDFRNHCVYVRRQLCRTANQLYFITDTKTKSGNRCIPMSPEAYETFRHIITNRPVPKNEMIIDGCAGFIFLTGTGKPKVATYLESFMNRLQPKVWAMYGSNFPRVSPHVLRHTFCTNMQQAGIDVKSLQYLMGHSNASVTLDVYTHTDYNVVKRAFDIAVTNTG